MNIVEEIIFPLFVKVFFFGFLSTLHKRYSHSLGMKMRRKRRTEEQSKLFIGQVAANEIQFFMAMPNVD